MMSQKQERKPEAAPQHREEGGELGAGASGACRGVAGREALARHPKVKKGDRPEQHQPRLRKARAP